MMEEQFMRGWAHGHERLSADLGRGLKWLRAKARRFVDLIAPSHASGEDAYFETRIPACRPAVPAASARVVKHR